MTKEIILDFLKAHKEEFLEKYQIEKMAIFGSYARDDAHKKSDVDIVYQLRSGAVLSFEQYLELEEMLKNAFGIKVDLINSKKLNPLIKLYAKGEMVDV